MAGQPNAARTDVDVGQEEANPGRQQQVSVGKRVIGNSSGHLLMVNCPLPSSLVCSPVTAMPHERSTWYYGRGIRIMGENTFGRDAMARMPCCENGHPLLTPSYYKPTPYPEP